MPKMRFKKSDLRVSQETIVFPIKNSAAIFNANDAIGDGNAFVRVDTNSLYPSPVLINFVRRGNNFGFALSKSEAKRLCLYILHQL